MVLRAAGMLLLFILGWSAIASAEADVADYLAPGSYEAPAMSVAECLQAFQDNNCAELFEKNPQFDKPGESYKRNCSDPKDPGDQWDLERGKECGGHILQAGADTVKSIVQAPASVASGIGTVIAAAKAKMKEVDACQANPTCIKQLEIQAGFCEKSANGEFSCPAKNWPVMSYAVHINKVKRDGFSDPAKKKDLEARGVVFGKPVPDMAKAYDDLLAKGAEIAKKAKARLACFNARGRTEIACYGVTLAGAGVGGSALALKGLKAVQKGKELASLGTGVKSGSQAAKAETVLGRGLSSAQHEAVEKAHLVGKGELGKDGINPAGIGNYTDAQLKAKAQILDDAGFSMVERRKLVESGTVGLPGNGPIYAADSGELRTRAFRDNYAANRFDRLPDENKIISFMNGSSREPGKVLGKNADGSLRVQMIDGRVVTLNAKQIEAARQASPEITKEFLLRGNPAAKAADFAKAPGLKQGETAVNSRKVPTAQGDARFEVVTGPSAREYALRRGDIVEHAAGRKMSLPVGNYWYVVLRDGTVVTGKADDVLEFGTKHVNLAAGKEVISAGELRVTARGYDYNLSSGSFSKEMLDRGVSEKSLQTVAGQAFENGMGRSGSFQSGSATFYPSQGVSRQRLVELCGLRAFYAFGANASACCKSVGMLCH